MDAIISIITNWLPMIALIIIWFFFMSKMKKPQDQTVDYLRRQNELMEEYIQVSKRIAVALENISEKAK